MPDQPLVGKFYFRLTLGGAETAGFFTEFEGIASENEVVEHKSMSMSGKTTIQKIPGTLKWANLVLKRGVDKDSTLWMWRKQVVDGLVNAARRDGTLEILDDTGAPTITYKFLKGWPCKYSSSGIGAATNEVMVEEIEIAHEGFERV
jgi:phage tail-like protein